MIYDVNSPLFRSFLSQKGGASDKRLTMAGRGAANMDLMAALMTTIQNVNANLHQLNNQAAQQQQAQGPTLYHGLDDFCNRNPPKFEGGFAPDAANDWIQELEKIFRTMIFTEEQKVAYATYMLVKEAENWWEYTERQMEHYHQTVNWVTFKERFLQKYFSTDMKIKKEMEFLRLEQGNMSVGEYAAKFEDLVKYSPHYNHESNERSKCALFEYGLKHDLKVMFVHQQIPDFPTLVNKYRIYEDSVKARNASLRSVAPQGNSYGPQRNFGHGRGKGKVFQHNKKPYGPPMGNQQKNFKPYNNQGFQPENASNQMANTPPWCQKCKGKHFSPNCPICYECNQPGHINRFCPQLKQEGMNMVKVVRPQAKGKVYTMSGAEVKESEDLI